jgi:GxxExxY protein
VKSRLIVEIKAVQNLLKEHEIQLVNYLAAQALTTLLINFGTQAK